MRRTIRSDTPSQRREPDRLPHMLREPARDGAQVDQKPERAVLVSVLTPHSKADLRDPLGELAALAESAGVEVVDRMVQKRASLVPATALGKGRLQELAERVVANQADTVIFDNDLAPRQIRGVEEVAGRKVIDRSELILDIFARRARTREAQLQVELAQLEYTAPRLRGMWTHLERVAGAGGATGVGAVGGVGTRGPGEKQIEIDRRIVRDRLSQLRRELEEIDRRKQREVLARADQFTVSLVGYTNAGKSTLMNRLTGAGRYAADQLFATLDTKTVRWDLGDGKSVLLSDTVGFVRDIPHHLVASFRATLEEATHASLLLHVVDGASSVARAQMEAVEEVLRDIGCDGIPQIVALNKVDAADHTAMAEVLALRNHDVIPISALTGEGLDALADEVRRRMQGASTQLTLRLPHHAGKALAEVDRSVDVTSRRYFDSFVELDVRSNPTSLAKLLGRLGQLVTIIGENPLARRDAEDADDDFDTA